VGKKILIIDDDPDFIEATSTLLEANGYEVMSAPDGDNGFKKAKSEKPDLMLLDVMMTYDSEGFDLAIKLRDEPQTKQIPVIMITGIRRAKTLPFGIEPDSDWLPVKNILEKPVKPELLLSTVAEALPS
jgi:CheY-like chemotaxis protein